MSQRVEFVIPFELAPKQTKGNRVGVTKAGKRYMARYTPKRVRANAEAIVLAARPHRPDPPLKGPVAAQVRFVYPLPKSMRAVAQAGLIIWKDTRPDLDNLEKQLFDSLEAAGFFAVGDGQVCCKDVEKAWQGTEYKTIVMLEEL